MSIPIVSIVMPNYNGGKYLHRTIESVLGQTMRELELIVVDDGSTDGSQAIITEYANRDCRVKPILKQENEGSIAARLDGIRAMRGEYLYQVDSDDMVRPDALHQMIEAARANDADMIVCGADYYFSHSHLSYHAYRPSKRFTVPKPTNTSRFVISSYFGLNPLLPAVWNKLIHRRVINTEEINPPKVFLGDDTLIMLPMVRYVRRLAYTDYAGYLYRPGGGSEQWVTRQWADYITLIKHLESMVDDYALDPAHADELRRQIADQYSFTLMENLQHRIFFNPLAIHGAIRFLHNEIQSGRLSQCEPRQMILQAIKNNLRSPHVKLLQKTMRYL